MFVKKSLSLTVIIITYEVKDKQPHRGKIMEMITIIMRNNV